jgi:YD repeat-containing protein
VQFTWTPLGPVGGDGDAGGSVTNGAASPMPLSSNPSSNYRTASWGANQSSRSRSYRVRVDFYDAYGTDISQSTFTITASVQRGWNMKLPFFTPYLLIVLGAAGEGHAATTVTRMTYDAGDHVTSVTEIRSKNYSRSAAVHHGPRDC